LFNNLIRAWGIIREVWGEGVERGEGYVCAYCRLAAFNYLPHLPHFPHFPHLPHLPHFPHPPISFLVS